MAITNVNTAVTYASLQAAITALGTLTENTTIDLVDAVVTLGASDTIDWTSGLIANGFDLTITSSNVGGTVINADAPTLNVANVTNPLENVIFENITFNPNTASIYGAVAYGKDVIFRNCTFNFINPLAESLKVSDMQVGYGLVFEDCTINVNYVSSAASAVSTLYAQGQADITFTRTNITTINNTAQQTRLVWAYNDSVASSNIIFQDSVIDNGFKRFMVVEGFFNVQLLRTKYVHNTGGAELIRAFTTGIANVTNPGSFLARNSTFKVTDGELFYFEFNSQDVDILHNTFILKYGSWSTTGNTFVNLGANLHFYGNHFHYENGNHPGGFVFITASFTGVASAARFDFDYNYVQSPASGGTFLDITAGILAGTTYTFNGAGLTTLNGEGINDNGVFSQVAATYTFVDYVNDDYDLVTGTGIDNGIDIDVATDYSGGVDGQGYTREATGLIAYGAFDPGATVPSAVPILSMTHPATVLETDVAFVVNVTDDINGVVQGADVTFDNWTFPTDVNGNTNFPIPDVAVDTVYTVDVAKAGSTSPAQGSVTVQYVAKPVLTVTGVPSTIAENTGFTVNVMDGITPVQNAVITFWDGRNSQFTNVNGDTTVVTPGVTGDTTFNFSVSKTGYELIADQDIQVLDTPSLSFAVANSNKAEGESQPVFILDQNGAVVQGAVVTFEGTEYTTDAAGRVDLVMPFRAGDATFTTDATVVYGSHVTPAPFTFTVTAILELFLTSNLATVKEGQDFILTVVDNNGDPVIGATIDWMGNTTVTGPSNSVTETAPFTSNQSVIQATVVLAGYSSGAVDITVVPIVAEISVPASVQEEAIFTVRAQDVADGEPLEGVSLTFDGVTLISNSLGEVAFTAPSVVTDTNYTITLTSPNFESDSTVVIVTDNLPQFTYSHPATVDENTTFTVNVLDENGLPMEGETVAFNSGSGLTDVNGNVTFTAPDVEIDELRGVSVTIPGYQVQSTTFLTVQNVILPNLSASLSVATVDEGQSFFVTVLDDNGVQLRDVNVLFDGVNILTDNTGSVILTAPQVNGSTTLPITVSKVGYAILPDLSILVQDIVLPSLVVSSPVTIDERSNFFVTVTSDSIPVQGVAVIFDSITYTTDNAGQVSLPAPPVIIDTAYGLAFSKAGYENYNSSILVVDVQETFDVTVVGSVDELTPFTVRVKNNFGDTIENASISFDSQNYLTNFQGEAVITAPNVSSTTNYSLFISKAGITSFSGVVSVQAVILPTLSLSVSNTIPEETTFTVIATNGVIVVSGVSVVFNGETKLTDLSGEVSFLAPSVLTSTSFSIAASREGYLPNNTSLVIQNTTAPVLPSLTITYQNPVNETELFTVTVLDENSTAVHNANISFNGTAFNTNILGQASFAAPSVENNTSFVITTTKSGFQTNTSTINVIAVAEATKPQMTILEPLEGNENTTLILTITDESTLPINGAILTFNGVQTYSNAQGQVALDLPATEQDVNIMASFRYFGYGDLNLSVLVKNVDVVTTTETIPIPDFGGLIGVDPSISNLGVLPQAIMSDLAYDRVSAVDRFNVLLPIHVEKAVIYEKYKLNSYLKEREELLENMENLNLYVFHRASHYLGQKNNLQTLIEELRTL